MKDLIDVGKWLSAVDQGRGEDGGEKKKERREVLCKGDRRVAYRGRSHGVRVQRSRASSLAAVGCAAGWQDGGDGEGEERVERQGEVV